MVKIHPEQSIQTISERDEIYDFMKFIVFGLCICVCICVGLCVSLILLIENDIQDGSNSI
tara:strand:+ start:107 stop:286 length:180 start_codon:yes stop_codon:yes gene_type:complete